MIKLMTTILIFFLSIASISIHATEPLPNNLISIETPSGLSLLKKNLNLNAAKLLSHFNTQKTVTYCGVASVVMVLNAADLPPPLDEQHLPYHAFTQDNFFIDPIKAIVSPDVVKTKGITLEQLSKMINAYGLKTTTYSADQLNFQKFKQVLVTALHNQQYVIVNFYRAALHEEGGGHHSPIAAYDKASDRFLLLDVARYKYPAYWVKAADLWKAVDTEDHGIYRGMIVITPTNQLKMSTPH